MITEQGYAALAEFGFDLVELDEIGAPTPGRIADRLTDISERLEASLREGCMAKHAAALSELRRLRLALDAWDIGMMRKQAEES